MTALLGPSPSLGTMCAGDVEIKAFGPQVLPLSDDLKRFGIKAAPEQGWACCLGMPEVWFEVKAHTTEEEYRLDLRFVGLKPQAPIGFVFYAKAMSCTVENERLKPKSLRRFHGEISSVLLQDQLLIETDSRRKVQVIPLAGDDSFWQAQFLICFEIHPFAPQCAFSVKKIAK